MADLSNPMRTWPTAADWAQRCLSEFFAQVWRQKGSALRHCLAPPCAGCTRCARNRCCHRQCVGGGPVASDQCGICAGNGVRSPAACVPSGGHREAARPACQPDVRPRDDTARAVAGVGVTPSRRCLSLVHAATLASGNGAHARSDRKRVGRPAKRTCYSSLRDVRAVSAAPLLRAHALRSV